MKIKDQLGRNLDLKDIPKRIVSLVPSQTELLVDLNLESSIVGVTKFCVHPKHLIKNKEIVGGTKQVNIDKIKALRPDIILCNKEENTQVIVEECEGICPVHVSDVQTIEESFDMIHQYGKMFNTLDLSKSLIKKIRERRDKFKNTVTQKHKPKVAYFIWRKPYMVAGDDTFINFLIEDAGFENVFKDRLRYPEISLAELKNENIDFLFLSSEPFPFAEKHKIEFHEVISKKKIVLVDGEYFSWYGSRLLKAFPYFEKLRSNLP